MRGPREGIWLVFALKANLLVGRLDRQREEKKCWCLCLFQLLEPSTEHQEAEKQQKLLTVLEACMAEIQADCIAALRATERGHLLPVFHWMRRDQEASRASSKKPLELPPSALCPSQEAFILMT